MKKELTILRIPIKEGHEYQCGTLVEVDEKHFSIVRIRQIKYSIHPEHHYILCSAREIEVIDCPF
ncbi:hypothetical protein U9K47_10365 [Bacillus toyonensis]|uniref:hypothetical protein n=1 Tax=Bacillus toyonensis TaxID=155322 RepID=UPI000B44CA42|nr:hypothetical protein BK702_15380 [Bacillus thuringiensis serovar cameroun]